jgi:PAS domain-containing protein
MRGPMSAETKMRPWGALAATAILERIDDGICILDRSLSVAYANAAAGRILGRTPAELSTSMSIARRYQ